MGGNGLLSEPQERIEAEHFHYIACSEGLTERCQRLPVLHLLGEPLLR